MTTVNGPTKVVVVENGKERLAFSIEAGAQMSLCDVYERLGFDMGEKHVIFRRMIESQVDMVTITGSAGGADIHTETPPPYRT